jgi:hypothetical protein
MRQSYFAKTGKERRYAKSPRTNGFFIDGNFRHLKLQFMVWKAHQAGLLRLLGVEVRVYHLDNDYAGTVDAIVEIDGEVFIVDFKGMNVSSFQKLEMYGAEQNHRIQIVGYALIANVGRTVDVDGVELSLPEVKRCLLVGENKGGPTQKGSPIGLHEYVVEVAKHKREVKTRINALREAVKNAQVPKPACSSTRIKAFTECPFSYFCREEVTKIQKQRENAQGSNPKKRTVKTPERASVNRSRGRTSGRKKRPA